MIVGERLSLAQYDALPRFYHQGPTVSGALGSIFIPVLFLLALSTLLGTIAHANLGNLQNRIREN